MMRDIDTGSFSCLCFGVTCLQCTNRDRACAVRMESFQLHRCKECTVSQGTRSRGVCSFCSAMSTSPENRSPAMRTVIEGEKLQLELLNLKRDASDEDLLKV